MMMSPKEHYIDHLYGVLQEECAELISAISKRKRFGKDSVSSYSSTQETNQNNINTEMNDLLAVIDMLVVEGERLYKDSVKKHQKTMKVNKYYPETFDLAFPDSIDRYESKTLNSNRELFGRRDDKGGGTI
jgi:NTP pyrophosphatase (non-canonical NTP hydrolase)